MLRPRSNHSSPPPDCHRYLLGAPEELPAPEAEWISTSHRSFLAVPLITSGNVAALAATGSRRSFHLRFRPLPKSGLPRRSLRYRIGQEARGFQQGSFLRRVKEEGGIPARAIPRRWAAGVRSSPGRARVSHHQDGVRRIPIHRFEHATRPIPHIMLFIMDGLRHPRSIPQ
jgi:hypothetical protein